GHSQRAHDTTTIRREEVFSLSSPKGGEGRGEEVLNTPHPNPLPTRSSRGEGEHFCWLCQHAPILSCASDTARWCKSRNARPHFTAGELAARFMASARAVSAAPSAAMPRSA